VLPATEGRPDRRQETRPPDPLLASSAGRKEAADLEPMTRLGRCLDRPARSLGHVLDDREPEAGPAGRPGAVRPVEALEQPRQVFWCDAGPVIRDREQPPP